MRLASKALLCGGDQSPDVRGLELAQASCVPRKKMRDRATHRARDPFRSQNHRWPACSRGSRTYCSEHKTGQ